MPLYLAFFLLLASFLLYKATAHQLISPAKLPTPLICLAQVSWTFSFFNWWNSNILTDSLSFSEKIRLSQDLVGRIMNRAQNPHHSLLLLWRLSKYCSLKISLPQSKQLGTLPGFLPAEDNWWNNMGNKSLNGKFLSGEGRSTSTTHGRPPEEGRSWEIWKRVKLQDFGHSREYMSGKVHSMATIWLCMEERKPLPGNPIEQMSYRRKSFISAPAAPKRPLTAQHWIPTKRITSI